jgi:hypothetical protein
VAHTFDDAQLGAWHGVRKAQYRIVVHIRTAHTLQWPASRNRSLSRIFCRRPTQTGCEPLSQHPVIIYIKWRERRDSNSPVPVSQGKLCACARGRVSLRGAPVGQSNPLTSLFRIIRGSCLRGLPLQVGVIIRISQRFSAAQDLRTDHVAHE